VRRMVVVVGMAVALGLTGCARPANEDPSRPCDTSAPALALARERQRARAMEPDSDDGRDITKRERKWIRDPEISCG
jgi:hypothetical protein